MKTTKSTPDTIPRDDARRLVGQKKIFGEDWIGKLSQADMSLLKGPYGPKKKPINHQMIVLVEPCPRSLVSRLERAWGRWERMVAQLRTVDDWLESHGFNCTAAQFDREKLDRAIEGDSAPIATPGPGRRARIGPRVEGAMRDALDNGLERHELADMTVKQLAAHFDCGETTASKARRKVLANARELPSNENQRNDAGK
jgi:hypothetical protein